MSTNALTNAPPNVSEAEIMDALDKWWEGELADATLPGDKPVVPDIMKPGIEIDSHRAVRALVSLEDVVKFEIPETVIKEGGYADFEEMKADLAPKLLGLCEKKRKKEYA